jgi:hypothetical protein
MTPRTGTISAIPTAIGLIVIKIGEMLRLAVLATSIASCSATSPHRSVRDPEIFYAGELEIRLYSDRELMLRSLPPIFAALAATQVGKNQIQVSGYFDKQNNRIYAIDDARTVIHEFKHYLEPNWRHEDSTPSGKLQQHPAELRASFIQAPPHISAVTVEKPPSVQNSWTIGADDLATELH